MYRLSPPPGQPRCRSPWCRGAGVDLPRPLAPDVVEELRRTLLAHLVIFFPRQQLGPAELLAFAERFGQPTEYPQMKGLPGYPHVIAVTKLEHERVNFGGVW